jgi:hypothetical protein
MDAVVVVDWSAASGTAPAAGRADGLWAAVAEPGSPDRVRPFRTRTEAREWLVEELLRLVGRGHRVLCGLDLCFGYPAGTADALGMPSGQAPWRWTWERIAREVRDGDDGRNDRFQAAARLNQAMGREDGPFWGNGLPGDITGLPRTKGAYPMALPAGQHLAEHRITERRLRDDGRSPGSAWQLSGAGSVGGQVLVGLPTLWRIRNHPALRDRCRVWPFEVDAPPAAPGVTLVEVYPSLLDDDPALHDVRDARQVLALVDGYRQMAADGTLDAAFALPDLDAAEREAVVQEEGWILPVRRDPARPRPTVGGAAPAIPRGLVEAIAAGRCVALVGSGAGSGAGSVRRALVEALAADPALPEGVGRQAAALLAIDPPSAEAVEAAAQLIADALPADRLGDLLHGHRERLRTTGGPLDLLTRIPFAAIVTTALEAGLDDLPAEPDAVARALRDEPMPWWHEGHWTATADAAGGASFAPRPPPVLRLHATAGGLVADGSAAVAFTEQDRRRAVAGGGYQTLLRSLLATRTVLYLGDAFDDPHVARLRADVVDLLGHDRQRDAPLGYAVVPDLPPALADHHRSHQGIEVLAGADGLIDALHAEAGHDAQLRRAVAGRTILWVDQAERDDGPGIQRLREVVGDALLLVGGPSEARTVLRSRAVDLVVTHWGDREGGRPVGEEVLANVRASRHPCPTLVFAWGDYADESRPRALALGATDHVWSWPALFREIARVLAPSPRTPLDLSPRLGP